MLLVITICAATAAAASAVSSCDQIRQPIDSCSPGAVAFLGQVVLSQTQLYDGREGQRVRFDCVENKK